MSCTDIAKYFPHFPICRGTVFAVPRHFYFGTFCPKVKERSVSTGPQTTGFGETPQQAFWQVFFRRPAQKSWVCSHSNCLPKTQVWLHLPCLPLVRTPETPRKNGGSAVSYAPSVSLAFCIPSAVASMIVNSFSSIVFSILSMCWRQSLSSFCLSG